jgi:hypothetical protein
MARIRDSRGRQDPNSGYGRLFGNDALGRLISRVHVGSIRNGNELESILWQHTPYRSSMAQVLGEEPSPLGQDILVASGAAIQQYHRGRHQQPLMPAEGADQAEVGTTAHPITDLVILNLRVQTLSVVEVKDGDTFDTKKADGELESARRFATWIRPMVPYRVQYFFCSFNQADKLAIVIGIKSRFSLAEVMTGQELCEQIGVDYAQIRALREQDQQDNREYFVDQLLAIPELRLLVEDRLRR